MNRALVWILTGCALNHDVKKISPQEAHWAVQLGVMQLTDTSLFLAEQ